jgi:hypothetical protein
MRNKISRVTRIEFLPSLRASFDAAITKCNILGGFRGAGLVPLDLEAVISKPDVRLRTPPVDAMVDAMADASLFPLARKLIPAGVVPSTRLGTEAPNLELKAQYRRSQTYVPHLGTIPIRRLVSHSPQIFSKSVW